MFPVIAFPDRGRTEIIQTSRWYVDYANGWYGYTEFIYYWGA